MAAEIKKEIQLEIAHVLFIDIVAYSTMSIDDQRAAIEKLNEIVQATDEFRAAESKDRLVKIATGDGMALIFYQSPEAPVECALQISRAIKEQGLKLRLRMGVNSGPVSGVIDVNGRVNVAGAGINVAQRVMDCGDAGHILLSKRVAEDLNQFKHWRPHLYDLGECEVKHGKKVSLVNLFTAELGNSEKPKSLSRSAQATRVGLSTTKPLPVGKRAVLIAACAVVAMIAVGSVLLSKRRTPGAVEPMGPPEKSIAVLPFENLSEDKTNAYFAEGIQEEILTRLAKIADLKVISRTSTLHYQNKPDNLPKIAQQLGAANILEGSVQKAADQVRVNVQLINARNDSHLWADKFDRKLTDIFAVESEIAGKIVDTLQVKLTGREQNAIAQRPTENTDAHDLYLKGRYSVEKYTAEGLRSGIAYFEQAIELDPNYALAYSGIAYAYWTATDLFLAPREAMPKASEAAKHALQLNDILPDAHLEMGIVHMTFEFDWPAAEREFRRAIELGPNDALAHVYLGWCLTSLGRVQEGIQESERAVALDPLSAETNTIVSQNYYFAHRYDLATAQARKAAELDSTYWFAHFFLGVAYEAEGNYARAIAEMQQARTLENSVPWTASVLAHAYAMSGRRAEAEELLNQLLDRSTREYVPAYNLAEVYVGLGEKEKTLAALEQSYNDRSVTVTFLKTDPRFDSLRPDPRFKDLLRRIGFTE